MFWELDRDLKKILNNFIDSGESVRVGESAPSFSAIDSDLNEFDFADYKSENVYFNEHFVHSEQIDKKIRQKASMH